MGRMAPCLNKHAQGTKITIDNCPYIRHHRRAGQFRPGKLNEETMEQITIAGHSFNVPVRYEEGHELTAGEASALNQTYHENLRNNFAKKVKDAGAAADLAALQAELDAYAEAYAFGVRTAGTGVSRDPVMSEAMRIAVKQIKDLIRSKGGKPSDYESSQINEAAKKLLSRPEGEQIMAVARARVEEQKQLATSNLGDLLSGLTAKEPEAAPAPAADEPAPEQAA
jgi:hypothetical protein